MVKRRLPLLCPSNSTGGLVFTEPCSIGACRWWKKGCTAQDSTADALEEILPRIRRRGPLKACLIADDCRWHHDALRAGQRACLPRSRGMVCEHQGGDFNVFELEYLMYERRALRASADGG